MRRIVVKEARPGMIAARNVGGTDGQVLLENGDTIGSRHLAALHGNGIYEITFSDFNGLDPRRSPPSRSSAWPTDCARHSWASPRSLNARR